MFIALGVIILLVILALTGRKSVHHEISIEASPSEVWNVLIDTDSYDAWNPVMKLLEGNVKEGHSVLYQFSQSIDKKYNISSTVKEIIPNKKQNQGGGSPFILSFNHQYLLESSGDKTKLTIHEDYKGIGVHFWNPKPVELAYIKLNKAIKKEVEKNNK